MNWTRPPRWRWFVLLLPLASFTAGAGTSCALLPCCRLPLLGGGPTQQWAGEIKGPVERVSDADTLRIAGQRIRLYGIDTPELTQQCASPEGPIPCGVMSRDHLERLVDGRNVLCQIKDRDRYGRYVATCKIPGSLMVLPDTDLSARMVHDGMALAYRRYSLDYVDEETQARAARRGLWNYQFENPADYRRTH